MNPGFRILLVFLALFMGGFLSSPQAHAARAIAQIASFKGEVIVQSDTEIVRVTQLGLTLKDGDRIQTKQGEVQIIFNDGAVMKVRPFTSTMIQEREEKSGWWIFKTKRAVRRITCFIGKLWLKTGASKRRNYLQTPTAVAGVRGSEGEIGFDNVNTYLNMYSGEAEVVGKVIKGFFAYPGINAATKSRVYQSLIQAAVQAERATTAVQVTQARVAALQVVREAATELQNNPDTAVAGEAQVAANVAVANIAAGQAQVAVAQLQEAGADQSDISAAQVAADNAQAQATAANQAANEIYVDGVLDPGRLDEAIIDTGTAAENAQTAMEEATSIRDEVVPPEEVPPEEIPPEEVPPEEVPLEAVEPDTETSEQEVYQEEASPSQ